MKILNKLYSLGEITVGENPRTPNRMFLETLIASIIGEGLKERIRVWLNNGIVEVIMGHRRLASIATIQQENPAEYTRLFPQGIPCSLVEGVTPEEVIIMKLDHSEQVNLGTEHELQRSANMLFAIGRTEEQVAVSLAGLIERISPLSAKIKTEIKALEEKVKVAEATGNPAVIQLAKNELRQRFFVARHGIAQRLHNAARCPELVMSALYFKDVGAKPKDFENQALPILTVLQQTELYKAHFEDCKSINPETGVSRYNRKIVGPLFQSKWNELVAKSLAPKADKTPVIKSMARDEIQKEIIDLDLKSELAVRLSHRHMGDKNILVSVLDQHSYFADLVRHHNPVAWVTFVEVAKAIEAELMAKPVEATAAVVV